MKFFLEKLTKKENIEKTFFVSAKLFPFLVVVSYFFLLLETFTYIGFLRNFFLVDSRFFLIITLFSGVLTIILKKPRKTKRTFLTSLVFQVNTLMSPVLLVSYYILLVVEARNYANYVFSTFHLQPQNVSYLVIFNVLINILFVIDYTLRNVRIKKGSMNITVKSGANSHRIVNLLKINTYLFPLLVLLTYLFLFIETYTYSGFLWKHLLLNSKIFASLAILSGIAFSLNKKEKKIKYPQRKFSIFNIILSLFLVVIYILMHVLEDINYPNYVFSTFHLQLEACVYLVIFSIIIAFLSKADISGKFLTNYFGTKSSYADLKFSSKLKITFFINLLIMVTLGAYLFQNLGSTIGSALKGNIYIFTHLGASYDEKMYSSWNFYYNFMNFVNKHTESGSIIAIPPSVKPWLTSGNSTLGRYFVYPKILVKGSVHKLPEQLIDYVIIAKGEWPVEDETRYNWPKVFVPAEKIWYFNLETGLVVESNKDFYPSDQAKDEVWGLIKVDKSRL